MCGGVLWPSGEREAAERIGRHIVPGWIVSAEACFAAYVRPHNIEGWSSERVMETSSSPMFDRVSS